MAGNQKRPGATRRIKKGPSIGTGGKGRKALEGKGPTPKAEDRPYHKAYKAKQATERAAEKRAGDSRAAAPATARPRPTTSSSAATPCSRRCALAFPRTCCWCSSGSTPTTASPRSCPRRSSARSRCARSRSPCSIALADGSPHQGVALEVAPYEYLQPGDLLEAPSPIRLIALDGIQDPRNLGAILRSAAAFGAHGAVIPERRAAGVTVAAWKVSAGAAARLPVARATNLVRALEDYKKAGLFVIGPRRRR